MGLDLIYMEEPVAVRPKGATTGIRIAFSSTNVSRGSWPGRGLLYSFLVHELAIFGLAFLGYRALIAPRQSPEELQMVNLRDTATVLYLPTLGGGSRGGGHASAKPGPKSATQPKAATAAPVKAAPGFTYAGPQRVVSDVPKPTSTVQTVLQPELKNLPILKSFVPLPNIVQIAPTPPAPLRIVVPTVHLAAEKPPEAPRLKLPKLVAQNLPTMPEAKAPPIPVVVPVIKLAPEKPLEAPKLELPATTVKSFPVMPAAKPPEPIVQKAEKPADSTPKPQEVAQAPAAPAPAPFLPAEGKDAHSLLALSPMPAPPGDSVSIPRGESRGRFAISPEPGQTNAKGQPGSGVGDASSLAVGIGLGSGSAGSPTGTAAGIGGGNAPGSGAAGSGTGPAGAGLGSGGASGAGVGSGLGTGGAGVGIGLGSGTSSGTGTGTGSGSGTGSGTGTGTGTGSGSGSGAGIGNGGGPFPGISIQGGSLQGGMAGRSPIHAASPGPLRNPYSVTIVSTSNSGGGLADFGVFRNEQVYTVYLDMRETVQDPSPTWTLQYATLRRAEPSAVADNPAATRIALRAPAQGLVPPLPLAKAQPQWPPELVQKYQNRLIVIYAVINKEGKFEQMMVKQSPNGLLNGPVMEALGKWAFRPAELNGEPIEVKTLLGIPVAIPQ